MISDVKKSDEGKYQCLVENMVGIKESKVATLTVHGKFKNSPFIGFTENQGISKSATNL